MQQIEEKEFNKKQSSPTKNLWLYILIILLISAVGFFIFKMNQPKKVDSPEKIYAQHFEPFRNFIVPIERTNDEFTELQKAFQAYENKEYQKAIDNFTTILLQDQNQQKDILFYKGIAELSIDKTDDAIPTFKEYLNTSGQFKNEANWYLGLGYLKVNELNLAKETFEQFVNNTPDRQKKKEALEILSSLPSNE
ncbi:MAG: hypothetical protein AAF599_09370 [Bacteroidota bacterium]